MKLNFAISSVPSLSLWWQQPLGKTYGLWYQNSVMFSDLSASRNTLLVLRLTLVI